MSTQLINQIVGMAANLRKQAAFILVFLSLSLYSCAQDFKLTDSGPGWVLEYKTQAFSQAMTREDSLISVIDRMKMDSIAQQEIIDTLNRQLDQVTQTNKGTQKEIDNLLITVELLGDSIKNKARELRLQNDSLIITSRNLYIIQNVSGGN